MKTLNFVKKYLADARASEAKTGLSATASLAQSALETGWGATVVGNMMFGVKDSDGINGNEQLVTTTEYLPHPNAKFPVNISVKKYSAKLYKYVVKDWFRKYNSPSESFVHHAQIIQSKPRYAKAWAVRADYVQFLKEVHKAGYATGPDYANICIACGRMIEDIIIKYNL